jgi:hypothetical protein
MRPYNPLVNFQKEMIPGFRRMERPWLVSQNYFRGENPLDPDKQPLLLTDYGSLNEAKDHLNSVKAKDKWAALIHLENPAHVSKLEEMASMDSAYRLFVAFVKDKKEVNVRSDRFLAEAVRIYINQETSWTPGRGEQVRATLELNLGELFLRIVYGGQVLKEKLNIFEQKLSTACVTTSPSRPVSEPYRITFQSSLPTLR